MNNLRQMELIGISAPSSDSCKPFASNSTLNAIRENSPRLSLERRGEGLFGAWARAEGIAVLALPGKQLKELLPANFFRSMAPFFNQANRNLDPTSSARLEREWLKKARVVSVTQPLLPSKLAPGVFEAVSNALYRNIWLNVGYRNAAGKKWKRAVMPLGLAEQGLTRYSRH